MTCDYNGQDIKLVLRSHDLLRHPFSLAVFEDRLYWTDWDSDGVVAANKYTGKEVEKVSYHATRFCFLAAFNLHIH